MRRKLLVALGAALLALSGWNPVLAQDEENAMTVTPVETYTCNYNEGKGPADLDKATAAWNKWMDKEDVDSYGAVTLTPWYHGEDTFDVGWLGYWNDGAAMGAGTDLYLAKAGDIAAGFADVVTCDSHSNFASALIKSPGEGEPPESLVVYFSDCTVAEGADWDAMFDGLYAWGEYMGEQEYGNGMWVLFPAFGGGGDIGYDFKLVSTYDNHSAAGKAYDKYGNGGGWQKRGELLGGLLDCDVSRVYNAQLRRSPAPMEE